MQTLMHSRALIAAALLVTCMPAQAQRAPTQLPWPTPVLPDDVNLSAVGEHVNINGIPARIYTFTTAQPPEKVIEHFRQQVESGFTRVADKPVLRDQTTLGGRVGDFWLTLQLQKAAGRTRGTWSATPRFIPDSKQVVVRPAGFPASAKLIQQIDSLDADKRSQMAVGLDPSPVEGVAQRLEDELREQGFAKQLLPAVNWPAPDRYVAVFGKAREEIWVTLKQERAGTAVMVNRLSALEVLE